MKPSVPDAGAQPHGVAGQSPGPADQTAQAPPFDLVVADASWVWTERLFSPLADLGVRVLLIKACDWRNAIEQRRPLADWRWPRRRLGDRLWQHTFILPPGWMKSYPRLGMRPLRRAVRSWRASTGSDRPLALAVSYPHYDYLRDLIRPDFYFYYNMDDYGLYWEARRAEIERLERQVVDQADLSIVCARSRVDELKAAVPDARSRIIHMPHGAPARSIAPAPQPTPAGPPADLAHLPRPYLGFVGSLEDRIDWPLVEALARDFAQGSVILIGRPPAPAPDQDWYRAYRRATGLPNVHLLGWRDQSQIGAYNASFDVCLIPYLCDHPFNRACCPTKIMDYMATSRPVVTTPLPECLLYRSLFHVADGHADFSEAVRRVVERGGDDGLAQARWTLASDSTWERTAGRLLERLRQSTLDAGRRDARDPA